MATAKKAEAVETVEVEPLSEEDVAKQNAEAEQAREEAAASGDVESSEYSGPLADLTDVDLVDPKTGAPAPLSASTENLQGTVSNQTGRAVLKVAVRGYIGEEPVVVLAANAGEFNDLIAALEEAATKQKSEFAKDSDA